MTSQQINWAKSHDWFISDKADGTIYVLDRYSQLHPDKSITHHADIVHWTASFAELRDWAGY